MGLEVGGVLAVHRATRGEHGAESTGVARGHPRPTKRRAVCSYGLGDGGTPTVKRMTQGRSSGSGLSDRKGTDKRDSPTDLLFEPDRASNGERRGDSGRVSLGHHRRVGASEAKFEGAERRQVLGGQASRHGALAGNQRHRNPQPTVDRPVEVGRVQQGPCRAHEANGLRSDPGLGEAVPFGESSGARRRGHRPEMTARLRVQ